MRDPGTGKEGQSYCFGMTLPYSRHQCVQFVFDPKTETWVGCHRRALVSFGGAPKELVIDNLKAAVIQVAPDNPILSEAYRSLASPGTASRGCDVPPLGLAVIEFAGS
ncbi:MAG: hypothetical protein A2Z18_08240 [Armatimonadetes bacterium RBG_16_58_9]|nr:MAG: hypothetical protein A2Z18_08240 [Armatimonadetes bacterium RBG_16_58_9]